MKNASIFFLFLLLSLIYTDLKSQGTTFWSEGFETDGNGTRYAPEVEVSPSGAGAGCNDYFSRNIAVDNCSGSDTDITQGAYSGQEGTYLWTCEDHDDGGVGGSGNYELFINFTNIPSISGKSDLGFRGRFAAGNTTAYDNNTAAMTNPDFMVVEYQIDGGGYQTAIGFHPQLTIAGLFNTEMAQDTDNDQLGDGTVLNTTLQSFQVLIPATGNTLDLRIRVSINSGNEELAFDFFELVEDLIILPVEFISFTAHQETANIITLNWTTASEIDNKGFEIQRSLDGRNFTTIGFVAAGNDSQKTKSYGFTDTKLQGVDTHYYRLKQVDIGGSSTNSSIVVVNLKKEGKDVRLFPNPVDDFLYFEGKLDALQSYQIMDVTGKTYLTGQTIQSYIDVSTLPPGVYLIQLMSEQRLMVRKIMVK